MAPDTLCALTAGGHGLLAAHCRFYAVPVVHRCGTDRRRIAVAAAAQGLDLEATVECLAALPDPDRAFVLQLTCAARIWQRCKALHGGLEVQSLCSCCHRDSAAIRAATVHYRYSIEATERRKEPVCEAAKHALYCIRRLLYPSCWS